MNSEEDALIQSPLFDSLDVILMHFLVEMLQIEPGSEPWSRLLEHCDHLKENAPQESWFKESYLELFGPTGEWTHGKVYEELNRQYGRSTPPIKLDLLSVGMHLHLPPLSIPLIPIARHPVTGSMTVASWLPGLSNVLQQQQANILKEFWCTDQVQAVWAEPGVIRTFLKRNWERVFLAPVPAHEDFRGLLDRQPPDDVPWIDAHSIVLLEKDQRELGVSARLMREILAVPVFRGQNIVTALSASKLSPQVETRLQMALRTSKVATVFQLRSDEQSISQLIDRAESQSIDPSKIFRGPKNKGSDGQTQFSTGRSDRIDRSSVHVRAGEEAEAVRLVNTCVYKAIQMRASDIIFAEARDRLRVRYKIDGEWMDEGGKLPKEYAAAVINHIKIKSGLSISIRKTMQDGYFTKEINADRYRFRVNTSLDVTGEKAVLRIQPDADSVRTLEEYGMPQRYIDAIDQTMAGSTGLVILTGPTGCGKSTTIYSIILRLDPFKQNILSCEDPIEIEMPNTFQAQIEWPQTFALWTRGLLRQAPCVAIVGEIRDSETVEAVIRVASSGHRVISTLHTNTAWDIPTRLMNFSAQPFYIQQILTVGISQRLVKMICPKCSVEVPVPAPEKLRRMGVAPDQFADVAYLRQGRGCPYCQNRGTYGRRAIFEALIADDEIKEAIGQRVSSLELRKLMAKKGEKSIFEKALAEAIAGNISLGEACGTRSA
jgi:type II secretory ATPase GspE/PulE/Tfp pilus assembly ATPase PilB-like protein